MPYNELQKYFSISFVVGAHIHKSSYVIVSKGATNPWYRVSTEIYQHDPFQNQDYDEVEWKCQHRNDIGIF